MDQVDVKVTYMELRSVDGGALQPPREGLLFQRALAPSPRFYRFLYYGVGKNYNWHRRGELPDAVLAQHLSDDGVEVHVLHVLGNPAGFAELDCRDKSNIELVQFGLFGDYIGQGLGKYLLGETICAAWRHRPDRLWLHTCSLDHPHAIPNYQRAGFTIFKEEMVKETLQKS